MSHWLRHCADYPIFHRINPSDTVVDVGCGAGDACVAAGQLGAEVVGIDIDPNLVPHLHQRMLHVPARSFRAIASDCNPIPLPDGHASFVICTEVMEHVDDPVQFASELNRIGKPGATYLISVPDPVSESLMRLVAHPSYFEKPNHQRIFPRGAFDDLLMAAGLDLVDRPRSPNNFYWAMWCLLRWASSSDGNPEGGVIPPVMDHWNQVWASLQNSSSGEGAIELLDHLVPRTQLVISRKSDRVIKLADLNSSWKQLLATHIELSSPMKTSWNQVESSSRNTHSIKPSHEVPIMTSEDSFRSATVKSRWKKFFKNGQLKLGRVDLSWSIRRTRYATMLGSKSPENPTIEK